jgi:sorbitol/mannitol transport system permease protein
MIASQKPAPWYVALLGWTVALLMAFPIVWMALTAFKTEIDAISSPPKLLFEPTLENFAAVQDRADYIKHMFNSIVVSLGSTFFVLLLGVPAAYVSAFFPTKKTADLLLWMLSTKMMPAVGVLVPLYLIFKSLGLLDSLTGLTVIYVLINLPIGVWMLYSFFKEIPGEIFEAARMDGAEARQQIFQILLPLAAPGIASTALLCTILAWNEAFWSINLTAVKSGPLTAFIASFSSPEGLFWAKLSAASLMAIAPILILGILAQRQLVRGLTFGAVK